MIEFRVVWAIDVMAENAEDAAAKARVLQVNPESIATVFNVYVRSKPDSKPEIIDTEATRDYIH